MRSEPFSGRKLIWAVNASGVLISWQWHKLCLSWQMCKVLQEVIWDRAARRRSHINAYMAALVIGFIGELLCMQDSFNAAEDDSEASDSDEESEGDDEEEEAENPHEAEDDAYMRRLNREAARMSVRCFFAFLSTSPPRIWKQGIVLKGQISRMQSLFLGTPDMVTLCLWGGYIQSLSSMQNKLGLIVITVGRAVKNGYSTKIF